MDIRENFLPATPFGENSASHALWSENGPSQCSTLNPPLISMDQSFRHIKSIITSSGGLALLLGPVQRCLASIGGGGVCKPRTNFGITPFKSFEIVGNALFAAKMNRNHRCVEKSFLRPLYL